MIEPRDKRDKRLEDGSPLEIVETLLNSIGNFSNRQIEAAARAGAWDLAFIGLHSASVTIGSGLFGDSPLASFTKFLSFFVDTEQPGYDFSKIAKEIHSWRHVLVHRWLSQLGYEFGFDLEQSEGWRKVDGTILLNPSRFHAAFKDAFAAGGKIWQWQEILTAKEAEAAKVRLLEQYYKK